MRILPVIDLLDDHVVRAVAGERARYRPVRSRLAVDADPVAVCAALLELAPFAAVYVADLDAITRDGSRRNVDALLRLGAVVRRRGVRELWLDAGRAAWTGELAAHLAALGVELVPVIGSESLAEDERPRDLAAAHTDFALSLDHRAGAFIGPPAPARAAHLWPRRVLELLATLRERAKAAGRADVELHAGGGVRDAADLRRLETAGVAGALVATALHDGSLDAVALRPHFGRVAA